MTRTSSARNALCNLCTPCSPRALRSGHRASCSSLNDWSGRCSALADANTCHPFFRRCFGFGGCGRPGRGGRARSTRAELRSERTHGGLRARASERSQANNGEVLTVLGIAHLIAGGAFTAWAQYDLYVHPNPDNPGSTSLNTILVGVPLLVTGAGLTCAGIPLWVTGAERVTARHEGRNIDVQPLVPRIALGAGAVTLTVPF